MPTTTLLHYTTRGPSTGQPILLIHGMAASSRYWQLLMALLPGNYYVIAVDLLGYGVSPHPKNIAYTYQTHVDSLAATLSTIGIKQPVIVIGHSMGALLGLRLAANYPAMVSQLILCGLPYFKSPAAAEADITQRSALRRMIYYGNTSRALCTVWCHWLRPISRYIAPLYLRHVPRAVAKDSLRHTWQSYSQSLHYIIERQNVAADLAKIHQPLSLLYGQRDPGAQRLQQSGLLNTHSHTSLKIYKNCGHQLPIEQPQLIINLLNKLAE